VIRGSCTKSCVDAVMNDKDFKRQSPVVDTIRILADPKIAREIMMNQLWPVAATIYQRRLLIAFPPVFTGKSHRLGMSAIRLRTSSISDFPPFLLNDLL